MAYSESINRLRTVRERIIDMVSILPWTLNLTVGKYRRSNPFEMVSTLRADVAMVI